MPGVGVGRARQGFEALRVPFAERGKPTDEYRATLRLTTTQVDGPERLAGSAPSTSSACSGSAPS
ncbi:hypothetical protein [Nonomuraea sp. JJY05]|uniref:hypothetical protein n=1 Tax=Nonomuraea sp. JJY05 TaxID=3350255 RepID=UPI00373E3DE0